jgi:adenosylcobinamide kinase/adenosylcobinamide-phosphate guanylyltransferase
MDSNANRQSILVLGGASSGKTAFAQRLAASLGQRVLFVGTAWSTDEEMEARIARHRSERPDSWRTIEEPTSLAQVTDAIDDAEVVIFDSLSMWVSRLIPEDGGRSGELEGPAALQMRRLLEACEGRCHLVMVSDEVGMGLVPTYPAGRRFTELLGRLNQSAVVAVQTVYLIVAGLPMVLKGDDVRRSTERPLW